MYQTFRSSKYNDNLPSISPEDSLNIPNSSRDSLRDSPIIMTSHNYQKRSTQNSLESDEGYFGNDAASLQYSISGTFNTLNKNYFDGDTSQVLQSAVTISDDFTSPPADVLQQNVIAQPSVACQKLDFSETKVLRRKSALLESHLPTNSETFTMCKQQGLLTDQDIKDIKSLLAESGRDALLSRLLSSQTLTHEKLCFLFERRGLDWVSDELKAELLWERGKLPVESYIRSEAGMLVSGADPHMNQTVREKLIDSIAAKIQIYKEAGKRQTGRRKRELIIEVKMLNDDVTKITKDIEEFVNRRDLLRLRNWDRMEIESVSSMSSTPQPEGKERWSHDVHKSRDKSNDKSHEKSHDKKDKFEIVRNLSDKLRDMSKLMDVVLDDQERLLKERQQCMEMLGFTGGRKDDANNVGPKKPKKVTYQDDDSDVIQSSSGDRKQKSGKDTNESRKTDMLNSTRSNKDTKEGNKGRSVVAQSKTVNITEDEETTNSNGLRNGTKYNSKKAKKHSINMTNKSQTSSKVKNKPPSNESAEDKESDDDITNQNLYEDKESDDDITNQNLSVLLEASLRNFSKELGQSNSDATSGKNLTSKLESQIRELRQEMGEQLTQKSVQIASQEKALKEKDEMLKQLQRYLDSSTNNQSDSQAQVDYWKKRCELLEKTKRLGYYYLTWYDNVTQGRYVNEQNGHGNNRPGQTGQGRTGALTFVDPETLTIREGRVTLKDALAASLPPVSHNASEIMLGDNEGKSDYRAIEVGDNKGKSGMNSYLVNANNQKSAQPSKNMGTLKKSLNSGGNKVNEGQRSSQADSSTESTGLNTKQYDNPAKAGKSNTQSNIKIKNPQQDPIQTDTYANNDTKNVAVQTGIIDNKKQSSLPNRHTDRTVSGKSHVNDTQEFIVEEAVQNVGTERQTIVPTVRAIPKHNGEKRESSREKASQHPTKSVDYSKSANLALNTSSNIASGMNSRHPNVVKQGNVLSFSYGQAYMNDDRDDSKTCERYESHMKISEGRKDQIFGKGKAKFYKAIDRVKNEDIEAVKALGTGKYPGVYTYKYPESSGAGNSKRNPKIKPSQSFNVSDNTNGYAAIGGQTSISMTSGKYRGHANQMAIGGSLPDIRKPEVSSPSISCASYDKSKIGKFCQCCPKCCDE